MKTLNSKAICLILALTTHVLAQRFTSTEPDVFQTGRSDADLDIGYYVSYSRQTAALGEKNSSYSNLMLLAGRDTVLRKGQERVGTYNVVSSHGKVLGTVHPLSWQNIFKVGDGISVNDNYVSAVVVLDSLSDSKKTAVVAFASLRKLVVMQIAISETNNISFNILNSEDMPDAMWQAEENYNYACLSSRRLTLLGTSKNGASKVYNLATGNPCSKNGTATKSGRVDFFSIIENSWVFSQPNTIGLTTGVNGLFLSKDSKFGTDLVAIDNLDGKGGKALAVLLPASTLYPKSAIYIFSMDNDWTPSAKFPAEIIGTSNQNCHGLSVANWGDGNSHLLISCTLTDEQPLSKIIAIKDIVLDSAANILYANNFFYNKAGTGMYLIYDTQSNPLAIKNHKNDLYAISLAINGPTSHATDGRVSVFSVMDADYSKNFSIMAGTREAIVNIDSLFYNNGTRVFSAKTFFGSAKCEIQGINLICQGSEKSIGSWSGIELSSNGNCDLYKACKKKDTIFVYVRSASETSNTALRVPKSMLVPYFGSVKLGNVKPLAYFRNPNLQNTNLSWNSMGLKLSALANTPENGIVITPFSQKEGIDTLVFNLSISSSNSTIINNYSMYLHIADTSKILANAISVNPSNDTIWNTVEKRYIALPRSNSKGDIYTYDIVQDSLDVYAEIIGDYLHVLKIDIADISVTYTENEQIKHRKITLMPEPKALPPPPPPPTNKIANMQRYSLNAAYIRGGLQINGLNGNFEFRAYNLKGEETQKEKANAQGSIFVKLKQNCPQIVQILSSGEKISIFIPQ